MDLDAHAIGEYMPYAVCADAGSSLLKRRYGDFLSPSLPFVVRFLFLLHSFHLFFLDPKLLVSPCFRIFCSYYFLCLLYVVFMLLKERFRWPALKNALVNIFRDEKCVFSSFVKNNIIPFLYGFFIIISKSFILTQQFKINCIFIVPHKGFYDDLTQYYK